MAEKRIRKKKYRLSSITRLHMKVHSDLLKQMIDQDNIKPDSVIFKNNTIVLAMRFLNLSNRIKELSIAGVEPDQETLHELFNVVISDVVEWSNKYLPITYIKNKEEN